MNEKDISELLNKADELRSLFVLGQRVIPFLEEIFVFVSEIEPLLNEINQSIEDNLNKMPNASKQLSKVTEATELATTEIMDIVDGLVYKSDIISENMKQLYEINQELASKPIELLEILITGIENGENLKPLLPELKEIVGKFKSDSTQKFEEIVANTNEILQSISFDSSSIMMSLQVQDITSQQIAAVNHLLTTVQEKLAGIMKKFQNSEISNIMEEEQSINDRTNVSKMHRDIAFDPEAVDSLSKKDFRQSEVDSILKEQEENPDADEEASEDDISKLFDNPNDFIDESNDADTANDEVKNDSASESKEETPKNDVSEEPPANDDDPDEEFSQDDIDALFGK